MRLIDNKYRLHLFVLEKKKKTIKKLQASNQKVGIE